MIRTLIVDDQKMIREGIKVLLENSLEVELVGFAEDGETVFEKIKETTPEVVLLDINLPGVDGLTVANQIDTKFPDIKVIILSSYEDEHYVRKAMSSSAKGYLLKSVSAQELELSIKLVYQGYSAFKSELLASLNQKEQQAISEKDQETKFVLEQDQPGSSSSPQQQRQKSDELELLLARNQVRQKYSVFEKQGSNSAFHDVNISRTKKTIMSFEFKLLVFIILVSLGFLVFFALW